MIAEIALCPCSACRHTRLMLLTFQRGSLTTARRGCLCSSVVLYRGRQPNSMAVSPIVGTRKPVTGVR